MADMISKEYALAVIENLFEIKIPEEGDPLVVEAYKAGYRDALEQIKIDFDTVPVREKWIPISVKKPNEGQIVIVSLDREILPDADHEIIMTQYYQDIAWEDGIKAWMPLPHPYREPKRQRRNKK